MNNKLLRNAEPCTEGQTGNQNIALEVINLKASDNHNIGTQQHLLKKHSLCIYM